MIQTFFKRAEYHTFVFFVDSNEAQKIIRPKMIHIAKQKWYTSSRRDAHLAQKNCFVSIFCSSQFVFTLFHGGRCRVDFDLYWEKITWSPQITLQLLKVDWWPMSKHFQWSCSNVPNLATGHWVIEVDSFHLLIRFYA